VLLAAEPLGEAELARVPRPVPGRATTRPRPHPRRRRCRRSRPVAPGSPGRPRAGPRRRPPRPPSPGRAPGGGVGGRRVVQDGGFACRPARAGTPSPGGSRRSARGTPGPTAGAGMPRGSGTRAPAPARRPWRSGPCRAGPPAALGAEGPAGSGPEEPQIVLDLRGRPHRGAAGLGGILLLDGHGRGDPLHQVHVRLLHPLQELLGVGGQALHVPALTLGVDGVEGQRALPDPLGPVTTMSRRCGRSTSIPFRLCCRALRMTIEVKELLAFLSVWRTAKLLVPLARWQVRGALC
jgi:hypothetical protein